MRIILATPIYPPAIGGPAEYVKKLAEGLRREGIDAAVLSYGEGDKAPSPQPRNPRSLGLRAARGEGVIFVRKSRLKHFIYFIKLLALSKDADIVYAFDPLAAGLPAYLAAKLRGIKFVMRVGGDYLWERDVEAGRAWTTLRDYYKSGFWKKHKIVSFLLKRIFAGVDQFIFTTDFLAEIYKKVFKISGKIEVIPNPFAVPAAREVARENKIIFAGRFIKLKNLDNLIKVFKEIKTDCRLILIGDGPEKNKLELLAKDDNRIVVESPLPHDKLMWKVATARACILPSLSEASPNFALECLSAGTPILLTRENGLDLNLPENRLFNPLDNDDLKQKLTAIIDNPVFVWDGNLLKTRDWEGVIGAHLDVFKK